MAIDDRVIKTIQNLLARQNHPNANENEASVCAEKVQALLLKHNIELASVEAASAAEKASHGPRIQHVDIPMAQKKAQSFEWCLDIAGAVSFACTCQWLWMKSVRQITFVGTHTDIVVATELYRFLVEQIESLSIKETWGIPDIKPGEPTEVIELAGRDVMVPRGFRYWHNKVEGNAIKFRRGFLFGCAQRVSQRLKAQARATREQLDFSGQVTALVAVRDGLIRNYVNQQFSVGGNPGRTLRPKFSDDGYQAGFAAGDRVALNKRPQLEKR